jgi:hypothetical protein
MWMYLPYLLALLCAGSLLQEKMAPALMGWALFVAVTLAWYAYHASDALTLVF